MPFLIPAHLLSEAVFQGEFYMACQQIGLHCTLELTTPVGRLDAAVFSDDWQKLIAIVECKRWRRPGMKHSNQIKRYKQLGVPVFGLFQQWPKAKLLAEQIKRQYADTGIEFEKIMAMPKLTRSRHDRRSERFHLIDIDPDINLRV